jgi:DNA-binding YbaB/EbfC family protein
MPDFMGIMKKDQEMQAKMAAIQAQLEAAMVEGTAGGGVVTVRLNGKGEMVHAEIDPSLLKAEEKEIVQDLLVAAHAEARKKVEALAAEKMQEATAGLPLPPGLKLF